MTSVLCLYGALHCLVILPGMIITKLFFKKYSAKHFLITVFNISAVLQATSLAKVSENKGKTEISPKYDNI